jgi:hypothetical protein
MSEVDVLAERLKVRFGDIAPCEKYCWHEKPALCVLDCVLSLNRRYDKVVFPRVEKFEQHDPEVVELAHLQARLDKHEVGDFFHQSLNYKDTRREQTLRGVVKYLLAAQAKQPGESEWKRLQAWAASVKPNEYRAVSVRGFGLAGFQYLRMLFGVQTTKPDIYIIQFVSKVLGRKVNDVDAVTLLEAAAKKAELPLREVDGEIWAAGTMAWTGTYEGLRQYLRFFTNIAGDPSYDTDGILKLLLALADSLRKSEKAQADLPGLAETITAGQIEFLRQLICWAEARRMNKEAADL